MRNKSPNYNKIAANYNKRYQKGQGQGTLEALRRVLSKVPIHHVLEVGCGTCHWLQGLNERIHSEYFGIDKALKMLQQLKKPVQLHLCQSTAEQIPFKSESFEFIYCVNALHHFLDPEAFIRETIRLLRSKGTFAIIGMNPRDSRNKWYIYNFFDSTLSTDLARFPDWQQLQQWLIESNFQNIHLQDVEFIHDPKTPESVLEDPFLQKNGCSQLALLSRGDYLKGIEKLRKHAEIRANSGFIYENDIQISMLRAEKP